MSSPARLFSELDSVYNFLEFSHRLATAGQPTGSQFVQVRDAGFDTVINLAMPDSTGAIPDEDLLIEDLGMDYVPIPVRWEDPKPSDLHRFFAVMDERKEGEKLFVHCIANKRVSAFLYLYRVQKERVPEPEARADMHRIWTPNPVWQAFLDEQSTDGETEP